MKILALALTITFALVGCAAANVDNCIENETEVSRVCDSERDRDEITTACNNNAGFADGTNCSAQYNALQRCSADVLELVTGCDDYFEELDIQCSYEAGEYRGCTDRS